MEAKLLLIDSDRQAADELAECLRSEGFAVRRARDGVEGLALIEDSPPDLVLLALLLPRMDGWETCSRIRHLSPMPIIMVSARATPEDKARGLNLGADDYVGKPVNRTELVARIRAVLRRSRLAEEARGMARIDDRLAIDRSSRQVYVEGQPVQLTSIEYRLLACFLDNPNRVLTRQSLLTQVWGWEYCDQADYLKVYIHHLRKKIEVDHKVPRYIQTERGVGYRFSVPAPG